MQGFSSETVALFFCAVWDFWATWKLWPSFSFFRGFMKSFITISDHFYFNELLIHFDSLTLESFLCFSIFWLLKLEWIQLLYADADILRCFRVITRRILPYEIFALDGCCGPQFHDVKVFMKSFITVTVFILHELLSHSDCITFCALLFWLLKSEWTHMLSAHILRCFWVILTRISWDLLQLVITCKLCWDYKQVL